MSNEIFKEFQKKWKMPYDMVFTIYRMIDDSGAKYGKTSRILKRFRIKISPRKLKYFYRKVRLTKRYGTKKKIGTKNYVKLVEKRA